MTDFQAVSLSDFEAAARSVLPPASWDFVAGGSGAELALAANRRALDAVTVLPRVLAGRDPQPATTLLGSRCAMPVALAPMAYHQLMHPDGELASARACRDAGIPLVAGTLSSYPFEQIAEQGGDTWFQLYWLRDRDRLDRLIGRVEDAGCTAIVATVDVPVLGRRLRDLRNGFALPAEVSAANLADDAASETIHLSEPGQSSIAQHSEQTFMLPSWADLEWLRRRTSLPLAVKGILDPRDARRAVEVGVEAVVVSNHGGRQFDAAPASVLALPGVVAEVGRDCQVLFDSGVRSGLDVLRALSLGAAGVLVGRPLLWALAVAGEQGARQALELLSTELMEALSLAGCATLADAAALRTSR